MKSGPSLLPTEQVYPLLVLCGPSFSGKSTLAAALAARGLEVVSLDEINARRGLWGGDGLSGEEWAHTLALARAEVEARLCDPAARLVVDDTSCWRWLRDGWRELAARHGREVRLVVLLADEAELSRRRAAGGARRGIADAVLAAHLSSFEWP